MHSVHCNYNLLQEIIADELWLAYERSTGTHFRSCRISTVCFLHIIDDTWQVQLNIVITKMPYLIFVISIYSLHIDICKKDSKLT